MAAVNVLCVTLVRYGFSQCAVQHSRALWLQSMCCTSLSGVMASVNVLYVTLGCSLVISYLFIYPSVFINSHTIELHFSNEIHAMWIYLESLVSSIYIFKLIFLPNKISLLESYFLNVNTRLCTIKFSSVNIGPGN